jgi:phosphohistidine swiveling domain-containing protein
MLFLACVSHPTGYAVSQQGGVIDREYSIKGAFLYNFGRYVEWPAAAFADDHAPFVIGVLGTDPFGTVLDEITNSAKVDGRTVVAKRFATLDQYSPCHILFIPASTDAKVKADALAKLQNKGVLVVGEEDGLVRQGAVVSFYIENNKVRFEINVQTAKQQQLKVSSKLLSLAKIVDAR